MIDRLQSFTVQDTPPKEPRVEAIDSESATTALNTINSETTREILAHLHEEPSPASVIAETLDTSLSNVNYHIEKLESEGLITVADTWYSEKGKEMHVYAPTQDPIVLSGTVEESNDVRDLLARTSAAFIAVLVASVAVQLFVTEILLGNGRFDGVRKATSAGVVDTVAASPVPVGMIFLSGGTFALAMMLTGWYLVR